MTEKFDFGAGGHIFAGKLDELIRDDKDRLELQGLDATMTEFYRGRVSALRMVRDLIRVPANTPSA